ncbi:MAG TPA: ornithine cyclodeaminase family protein [Aggregicoccus sp.]|nr:ornithine cyclodeaminase family protein [Aggregicoccus sp.]
MSTLLLRRSDVARYLDGLLMLADLREAFRTDTLGRSVVPQRARAPVHAGGTALVLFPGCLPGIPAYSVKVHAKFPGHTPAIQGVIQLHDLASGELLAVMDSGHLTAVRTAATAALAADVLARPDARRVAFIGAGAQASIGLKTLRLVRTLERVSVYDTDLARAFAFSKRMYQELQLPVRQADSVAEAVADADIVVCATWSREPFLHPEMLLPGTHVTSLGADEPGKAECSRSLLEAARVVVDHRGLALSMGAVGNVGLGEQSIHAELGEVLAGLKPGRSNAGELTVFGGVGLPFMDLAAAWSVYLAAREDEALPRLDFHG